MEAIGTFALAPLTGGSFNPSRSFGPALVGNSWGGVWPFLVGPVVGSPAAVAVRQHLDAGLGGPASAASETSGSSF